MTQKERDHLKASYNNHVWHNNVVCCSADVLKPLVNKMSCEKKGIHEGLGE